MGVKRLSSASGNSVSQFVLNKEGKSTDDKCSCRTVKLTSTANAIFFPNGMFSLVLVGLSEKS